MANTDVQEIYVAYYGRPADPGGEAYWREQLDQAGGNLDAVIDAFGNSVEFTERFAELDTEALITGIYQRLFNREPDEGGLAFYTNLLDSGQKTLGSIALDILNGTTGEDVVLLDEKLAVATEFTRLVEVTGTTYEGEQGVTVGSNLIATIGSAWTEYLHEGALFLAGVFDADPAVYYHEPQEMAAQFLVQLRADPHYVDIDRYQDIGSGSDSAVYLKFDEKLVIDGTFIARDERSRDGDLYNLVDLAPGNYDIALSGGTGTLLVLFADSPDLEFTSGRPIGDDEDHLQIQTLQELELAVRVNGDAGSGDYQLTITKTDDTYRTYDLHLEPSRDGLAASFDAFYDYLFGA